MPEPELLAEDYVADDEAGLVSGAEESGHGESSHGLDTADSEEGLQSGESADDYGGRAYGAPYDPNVAADRQEGGQELEAGAGSVGAMGGGQPDAGGDVPQEQAPDSDVTLSGISFGYDDDSETVVAGGGGMPASPHIDGPAVNRHEEDETWADPDGQLDITASSQGGGDPTFVEVTNIDQLASDLNIELDAPDARQPRKRDHGDWQGMILTLATGSLVLAAALPWLGDRTGGGTPVQGEVSVSGVLESAATLAGDVGEGLSSWVDGGLAVAGGWFQWQTAPQPEESHAASETTLAGNEADDDAAAADTGAGQDQLGGFGPAQDDELAPWQEEPSGTAGAADDAPVGQGEAAGHAFADEAAGDDAVPAVAAEADQGAAAEDVGAADAGSMSADAADIAAFDAEADQGAEAQDVRVVVARTAGDLGTGESESRILFATNESFSDELLDWYSDDGFGSAASDAGGVSGRAPRGSAEEQVDVEGSGTLLPIGDLVASGKPLPWWHPSSVWRHSDLPGVAATDDIGPFAGLASPVLDSRTALLTESTGAEIREHARLLGVGTLKPLPLE